VQPLRLCCDEPRLDGTTVVGHALAVSGWAHAPAGIQSVAILIDGSVHAVAATGVPRPDVRSAFRDIGGAPGFASCLDVSRLQPGEHTIAVVARACDGRTARRSGVFVVDRDGAYRRWLESRSRPAGDRAAALLRRAVARRRTPPPLVCLSGSNATLRASLQRQRIDPLTLEPILARALERVAHDGGWLVVVEGPGRLRADALHVLGACVAGADARADVAYADEDALLPGGRLGAAVLKPEWSPELLLATDYVGPLVALGARAAALALAASDEPIDGVYALLTRLVDADVRVARVPEVLFTSVGPRPRAEGERAQRAIAAVAARRRTPARIEALPSAPSYRRIHWTLRHRPLVSVVIPTAGRDGHLRRCLCALARRTAYERFEVVLVDSRGAGVADEAAVLDGIPWQVVRVDGAFNFSRACNLGAQAASGQRLVFMNDDTEVESRDWLERLLEQAQQPRVAVVGCKLLYPDRRIQHAGVMLGPRELHPHHAFAGLPEDAAVHERLLEVARETSAVTGALMMVARDAFDELQGFDETLRMHYSDVDLCLRALAAGRRVIWTPGAVALHHEHGSGVTRVDEDDRIRFLARWAKRFPSGDPFYHPGLALHPHYEFAHP
jgi:GT2 family glycosyltransferase